MAPPRGSSLRPKKEPSPPSENNEDSIEPEVAPSSSKRRVVSSACIPCRRRKSKCDGALPACSTCLAVYRTECFYDADSDHRRKGALRRDIQSLRQHNDALDVILASLRSLPESESIALLRSLRSDADPDALANTLRTNVNLPQSFGHQTLEADFAEQLSAATTPIRTGEDLDSFPWNEAGDDRGELAGALAAWFRTVQDADFVEHLLELYFTWIHPFCPFLAREHFLRDMSRGKKAFCSTMLVNAVLAFACHYSARPTARTDPRNPSTAGDQFFEVAKDELDASDIPCLTTVQALGIMSMRETSRGRDSDGYQYAGRCVRMALELGLHLSLITNGLRAVDIEVRKITFWSVFNLETMLSVCVGRLSQLPRSATDVSRPLAVERIELQPWIPYVDVDVSHDAQTRQPQRPILFLNQLSSLSELASDMVGNFYSPKEPFTSRRLANAYEQYQEWFRALPAEFRVENTTLPHVIVLNMYYHACVLHLFRPYIKLDLDGANLYPRDTCTACANKISENMTTLRSIYGLRRTCQLVPSLVLSASTIHLLNLPDKEAAANLRQAILDLQAMTINHRFAARCIEIIQSLANKWSIKLPEGATLASSIPYDRLPSPSSSNFWTATIPQQQQHHHTYDDRGSRPSAGGSSISPAAHDTAFLRPIPSPLHQQPRYPPIYPDASAMQMETTQAPSTAAFWTPFPAQTMPVAQQHLHPGMVPQIGYPPPPPGAQQWSTAPGEQFSGGGGGGGHAAQYHHHAGEGGEQEHQQRGNYGQWQQWQ